MGDGSLFHVGENIELWRVLAHLCALVVAVVAFELALHQLEHAVTRSRKFEHMVSKAYRELMVLGLVGLALKLAKESTSGVNLSSILAFQIADLMIFILAFALIVQATCVFLRLRRHDRQVERAELTTTCELEEWTGIVLKSKANAQPSAWRRFCNISTHEPTHLDAMVQLRLLRRFFLTRYDLPQLFPFAKYLRQAQDNQLTHMIDVEVSTWVILLVIAWLIDGVARSFTRAVPRHDGEGAILIVFLVFAWALVGLHLLVRYYFYSCICKILYAAGYSPDQHKMHTTLTEIAREEAACLDAEVASEALEAMDRVKERHQFHYEAMKAHRHWLLRYDTGFQLVATVVRNVKTKLFAEELEVQFVRDSASSFGQSSEHLTAATDEPHAISRMKLRWFSRKAWHFLVILLLMLNGFYLALLIQCGIYRISSNMYDLPPPLSILLAIAMIAPLFINAVLLQPGIFRHYVIVSSVFRIDARTLTEVVAHFNEIVALRSEFASVVSRELRRKGRSVEDLRRSFESHDPALSGEIDLNKLRAELRSVGLKIPPFRFNSVVKLLFSVKGMRVQYAQILSMVTMADGNGFPCIARRSLLGQALVVNMEGNKELQLPPPIIEQDHEDLQSAESIRSLPALPRPGLGRPPRFFQQVSSRTLQQIFHADSARELVLDPPSGQIPIEVVGVDNTRDLSSDPQRGQTPFMAL